MLVCVMLICGFGCLLGISVVCRDCVCFVAGFEFLVLRVVGCGFCTILVIVGLVLGIVFLGVGSAMSVAGFGFCGVVW